MEKSKMKFRLNTRWLAIVAAGLAACFLAGCKEKRVDAAAEAPPPAEIEHEQDGGAFKVDSSEKFALATAGEREAAPELEVTGAISPDVSRNIPVISIATGRVVDIRARLGDTVTKGLVLMRIQSADIAQAFSDYRQAVGHPRVCRAIRCGRSLPRYGRADRLGIPASP